MKKTNLIKTLALFLLFCNYSFGQAKIKTKELSKEWNLIVSKDGVDFYVRKDVCVTVGAVLPYEYTFLKIVNTTNDQKSINYNYTHYFTEACDGCDPNSERSHSIDLAGQASVEGDCSSVKPGLTGFVNNPNFKGGWHFEAIEIKFVKITNQKLQ